MILAGGLAVAGVVYLATRGHFIFVPILLLLPLGFFARRRR
jgi:hypothetical protein